MRDILLIGYIAEETALNTISEKKDILLNYLSNRFIKEAEAVFREDLSKDVKALIENDSLLQIGKYGIFGALWDLAQSAGCGIKVDINDIIIRQETVEILDLLDINPYVTDSKGSYLLLAENGYAIERQLKESGIAAKVIGVETAGNDRIVVNGEETRYLTPTSRSSYF